MMVMTVDLRNFITFSLVTAFKRCLEVLRTGGGEIGWVGLKYSIFDDGCTGICIVSSSQRVKWARRHCKWVRGVLGVYWGCSSLSMAADAFHYPNPTRRVSLISALTIMSEISQAPDKAPALQCWGHLSYGKSECPSVWRTVRTSGLRNIQSFTGQWVTLVNESKHFSGVSSQAIYLILSPLCAHI